MTTLAVASNADLHKTTFGGQAVTSSDILVMYAYAGDANLDGAIDAHDFLRIDSNLNEPSSTCNYSNGDFSYDGKVNGDDYFVIDSNYRNAPLSDLAALSGVVAAPEPASLAGLLALTSLANLHPRRRQRA